MPLVLMVGLCRIWNYVGMIPPFLDLSNYGYEIGAMRSRWMGSSPLNDSCQRLIASEVRPCNGRMLMRASHSLNWMALRGSAVSERSLFI